MSNPRLAIVSDIHGNMPALRAVIADIASASPDFVVHAGDLVGNGSSNGEVIDTLADLGWPGVFGNTDELLWDDRQLVALSEKLPALAAMWAAVAEIGEFTRRQLSEDHMRFVRALPAAWTLERLTVLHASPGNAWQAPGVDASDEALAATYQDIDSDLVVFGHVHTPFIRHLGRRTIANCGAVSLSYDGDRRASYLLVAGSHVEIRRVEYDVELECRRLRDVGHPHHGWISAILRGGRFVPFA